MFTFAYPARLSVGRDGRVLVEFVDLPRVATDGKDKREALEEAMDALGSDLSICSSRREEIPVPSRQARVSHGSGAAVACAEAGALCGDAGSASQ